MHADGYEFDIFLSYRRFGEWPGWVKRTFFPLFKHWLGEELGQVPRIFVDYEMEAGCSWPDRLGGALARSRILVPLWSRQYFASEWCKAELAHMHAREVQCGLRQTDHPEGLIVPALIHDGEDLPQSIRRIASARLQNCSGTRVARNSPTAEKLEKRIKAWVPSVARAIHRAPPFEPSWKQLAIAEFVALFHSSAPAQVSPPLLKAS